MFNVGKNNGVDLGLSLGPTPFCVKSVSSAEVGGLLWYKTFFENRTRALKTVLAI